MKKKNKFWLCPLIVLGYVLILTNGCKKDDEKNNNSTVTDIDGNVYHKVKIGTQTWMVENLKTTRYRNGTPIENQTDNSNWGINIIGAYAWYENDIKWKDKYGALYNWYAVNNANALCPTGWHVPSDEEWKILEGAVDSEYGVGDPKWDDTGYRGFDVGKNLKSTSGWNNNGNGTDLYGFSALSGGSRYYAGGFYSLGNYGYWWSSDEASTGGAWGRVLGYSGGQSYRGGYDNDYDFSVRCLRD